ncbi:Zn-dependent protease [Methylobacterium sp. Leaf465]|uniref:metallopeptidase family protein n=1 Tax=Methylobacterium sp. Leaf465 TaxID=1736385 RepID=UPI0006F7F7EF|nr:metallopeptidase family protein [Methylobacterium sp. Leaf465]KQT76653.1 Zn-dependent protease [Methylobacterium sp. Leaf465]
MSGGEPAWTSARAPDLGAIEDLAYAAFANLPLAFRNLCAGLVIHVEDFPDEETLREMDCESPFDLLGLFRGIGLAQSGEAATGQMPNQVWLYRRPLLDDWAEHDETLGHLVTHVLVHEIGHHFGLSDADMEAIEAAADA